MAELKDKIKYGLDEVRILVLGATVLLGFQYQAVFQKGFATLPLTTQYLKVSALGAMLGAVALLLAPAAYHHLAAADRDQPDFHRFINRMAALALFPFALGLGIDTYMAAQKIIGSPGDVLIGLGAALMALFFWYGWEWMQGQAGPDNPRKEEGTPMKAQDQPVEGEQTPLKDKVNEVMTELRVVVPGAQALLGFQFAVMLIDGFDQLPPAAKYVHLTSLLAIALSTVLLLAPAAYHRIVEQGEITERIYRFACRTLLAAMAFLALGMAGDFLVVVYKVTGSTPWAIGLAALVLLVFYGLWFGFTLYRRGQVAAQKSEIRDQKSAFTQG